jgi:hypothetical protein
MKTHNQLVEDRVNELMATGHYEQPTMFTEYGPLYKVLGEIDYFVICRDLSHVVIGEAKTKDNNIGKAYHQLQRIQRSHILITARYEYISN